MLETARLRFPPSGKLKASSPSPASSLNIHHGKVTSQAVAESLGIH